MIETDILVVGGGPSGLMAAIKAAEIGAKVIVCEKNMECGRKLLLTGKGRCNITNTKKWQDFSTHIHPNSQIFKPSFYNFSNEDTIDFFNGIGLKTVVERGDRVFPSSMRSQDLLHTLLKHVDSFDVNIMRATKVVKLEIRGDGKYITSVLRNIYMNESDGVGNRLEYDIILSRSVIIATGGLSYPITGSDGDGYKFAKSFNHVITPTLPSLTALKPDCYDHDLDGVLLKNIELRLKVSGDVIQTEFGELQFTNDGIEGALGFRVSRKAVLALNKGEKVELLLDLKPAISHQELSARITRDLGSIPDKSSQNKRGLKVFLKNYLPQNVITPFLNLNRDISFTNLPYKLKEWRFKIKDFGGYNRAVVTMGGVALDEISRKSMESKLSPGLFFAGEVLDLDGDTGGYNLQIAFSTGAMAGESAARKVLSSRE